MLVAEQWLVLKSGINLDEPDRKARTKVPECV